VARSGGLVAECGEAKISQVVFDRNGFPYHGRISAVAEARAGGAQVLVNSQQSSVDSGRRQEKDLGDSINPNDLELNPIASSTSTAVARWSRAPAVQLLGARGGRRRRGHVGVGLGKATRCPGHPQGRRAGKKHLFNVPMEGDTIPHEVLGHFGAGRVLLKPAGAGTGVIAGGAVRAVMEAAGIRNILTKSQGSRNPHNVVKAVVNGLKRLKNAEAIATMRGRSAQELRG
jgi:small subunit ribosomal protein S5